MGHVRYKGLIDCLRTTVRGEGYLALYKGWMATTVKTTPACALTFVSYELILRHCETLWDWGDDTEAIATAAKIATAATIATEE